MAKKIIKIAVDILMFLLLALLMEEHLIPDGTHEWLGISLFLMFILHNIWNYKWYAALFKGKYTAVRIIQTSVNFLLMAAVVGCIVSSMMISGTVFAWMSIHSAEFGRQLHMLSTAWTFVLMSVHLGLHWALFVNMARRIKMPIAAKAIVKWFLRIVAAAIGIYGIAVFVQRAFYEELFLLTAFKNFDYGKTAVIYLLETAAMSAVFISLAYYAKMCILKINKCRKAGGDKNEENN